MSGVDPPVAISELASREEQWSLHWHVTLSFSYHRKRERFLDGADRFANAFSALSGAGAFAAILGKLPSEFGLVASAFAALTSTLILVYTPAATARRHSDLARDFKKLEAEICEAGPDYSVKQHHEFKARALMLEAAEPPQLNALVTQCHNELTIALDRDAEITPLPFWQRMFKNWLDFDQSKISRPVPTQPQTGNQDQARP